MQLKPLKSYLHKKRSEQVHDSKYCLFVCLFFRLALYVYEYLLHVGAQKSAQTFLSEVCFLCLFFSHAQLSSVCASEIKSVLV